MIDFVMLRDEDLAPFKRDMREAFQRGAEAYFGDGYGEVLPEEDINQSLDAEGSIAYAAMMDGQMVGGAIISFTPWEGRGDLDFLYVKHGIQERGVGKALWEAIEEAHPEVKIWETVTPYFDRRNVYFYLNVCGFHAVEFMRGKGEHAKRNDEDMLRFEKRT